MLEKSHAIGQPASGDELRSMQKDFSFSFSGHAKVLTERLDGSPQRLFALIDAGQIPDLSQSLRKLPDVANRRLLFEGTFARRALALSPLVLEIAADAGALQDTLQTLDAICHRLPVLSYLSSDATLDTLAHHLRNLLRIEAEESDFLLRFADTQMMAGIAAILTPAQHAAFFKGIGGWWIVDHRGALSELVQLQSAQPRAEPVPLPLQFDTTQNSALLDATRIPALAAQLRYADPAFGTLLSFAAQSECISRGVATAQDAGQADDTEWLSHCLEYWQQQHSAILLAKP